MSNNPGIFELTTIIDPTLAAIPEHIQMSFANGGHATSSLYRSFGDRYYTSHIDNSHEHIIATAGAALVGTAPGEPSRAVILGAGGCNDIPLPFIAETFDHTTLVDADPASSERALSRLPSELLGKVSLVGADITGIIGPFAHTIGNLVDRHPDMPSFDRAAAEYIRHIDPQDAPPALEGPYTFVSSHLAMSVIAQGPGDILEKLTKRPKLPDELQAATNEPVDPLTEALKALEGRLQSAHIAYLGRLIAHNGAVHFADTTDCIRLIKGAGFKRTPLVDEPALRAAVQGGYTELRPSKAWLWKSSPPVAFSVKSFALAPRTAQQR
ncbi:MAG TPA: hypothetical protein VLE73_00080 [Candidatus Saccharimonadales bacterium]|nr:hypothetical protein [Candidatus Saccharimonadales bacterium]